MRTAAVSRAASALFAGARKHKNLLALAAIVWYCAEPLAAARLFWDQDVRAATGKLLEAHLYFFDAALMILIAAVITRRLTLPVFAVAFALAGTSLVQWQIDVRLHDVLTEAGLFRWIFGLTGSESDQLVNPRSTKIVLFTALLPVLVAQLLIARSRSIDRAFVLMGTLAVSVTTFLFHTALPDGTMRLATEEARFVIRYAVVAEPEHATAYCAYIGARCTPAKDREELGQQLRSLGLDQLASELPQIPPGSTLALSSGTRSIGREGRPELHQVLVGFRTPSEGEATTLVFEDRQMEMVETVHERSFALLAIAAHGFWTLFTALLCALHHWRGRSRFFRPAQAA